MKRPFGKKTSGNVLVYVLVAVVLFGALSMMLTRQMDADGATKNLEEGKDRLRAEELINYATALKTALEQMVVLQNVLPTEVDFVRPNEAGYATAPHGAKVFHPGGGGVNVLNPTEYYFESGSAARGFVVQQGTNVEWTRTSASDIILTFLDIQPDICREINKRLYKSDDIPVADVEPAQVFIKGGGDDGDFLLADCPSCNEKVSLCVKNTGGVHMFYSVILAR